MAYENMGTGPAGPTGVQGPAGNLGPPGLGVEGEEGEQGPIGLTGPQGATGATGNTGATGDTGPRGFSGFDGSDGDEGPMGPPSQVPGPTGATGQQGPTFLALRGDDGDDGNMGPPGPTGAAGTAGTNGTNGAAGQQGLPALIYGADGDDGDSNLGARSYGNVTRGMLDATAKNWVFLGQATASNAVRTGTITWVGAFKQLRFEYFISGYNGAAVGRLLIGPTGGISETGTTFSAVQTTNISGTVAGFTTVSIPGWPTASSGSIAAVARWGTIYVQNVAGSVKYMWGNGAYGGTAATTAPTGITMSGLFNDSTNLVLKAELAVYDLNTSTTVSAQTFNSGTYLNVWGRNDD